MSARQRALEAARHALARGGRPAETPQDVVCCGHLMEAHDDDGCTAGWEPADPSNSRQDGCPCRVRGWAL